MFGVFILCILAVSCDSARILALVPLPSRSHWIVMEPLFQELASRGHHVTVFSSFPQKKPSPNLTIVDLSEKLPPMTNRFLYDILTTKLGNLWITTLFINEVHEHTCTFLKEPEFQRILDKNNNYDILITEIFGSDCFTYFAYKLNVPLISFMTSLTLPWAAERVGLPDNPSYIPNYLVNFSPEMTFLERLYNTVTLVYAKFWHLYIFSQKTQTLTEESFGESLPPLHEVVANTSLVLVNSYHSLSQSRPFPPNVIEVGGIHIKERQPLSKDLQLILDTAKDGVIVMSFGSLVRTSSLPKDVIAMFLTVFNQIPQTVILKFEDDLPEAPPNVVVRKWIPQRDIIEHENVKALITHGGLASTVEAVYFGKPLLGIPLYADQFVNINSVVRRGAGLQLDINTLSEKEIADALSDILNNKKYTSSMKLLSHQFRDRPMTPLETAVYWVEYVIRHQGAPHLRPASVDLPLYKYLLIDVIIVILVFILILLYTLFATVKWISHALVGVNYKVPKKIRNKKD